MRQPLQPDYPPGIAWLRFHALLDRPLKTLCEIMEHRSGPPLPVTPEIELLHILPTVTAGHVNMSPRIDSFRRAQKPSMELT